MKTTILFILLLNIFLFSNSINLYYTVDGEKIEVLKGSDLDNNFRIVGSGGESWLIMCGSKIGPNGSSPRASNFRIGALGGSNQSYTPTELPMLGIGRSLKFTKEIDIDEVSYILSGEENEDPLLVQLTSGENGTLFVNKDRTVSYAASKHDEIKKIFLIKLAYKVSRSQVRADTKPSEIGLKVLAIAFTERGIRKAIRRNFQLK